MLWKTTSNWLSNNLGSTFRMCHATSRVLPSLAWDGLLQYNKIFKRTKSWIVFKPFVNSEFELKLLALYSSKSIVTSWYAEKRRSRLRITLLQLIFYYRRSLTTLCPLRSIWRQTEQLSKKTCTPKHFYERNIARKAKLRQVSQSRCFHWPALASTKAEQETIHMPTPLEASLASKRIQN